MRLSSNVFLFSYTIFLLFAIAFVCISSDGVAINGLICAVSIASTSISFADLFYSKANIDKIERTQMTTCYIIAKYKENYYMKKIEEKYGEEANEMILLLSKVFDKEEIDKLFSNDLSINEKDEYINKIRTTITEEDLIEEISQIVENMFLPNGEVGDIISDDIDIIKLLLHGEFKERMNILIANAIAIFGFALLLVVLAWNNIVPKYIPMINNVLTISAFLAVVLNLLLKENYRSKSLKELAVIKKELYKM